MWRVKKKRRAAIKQMNKAVPAYEQLRAENIKHNNIRVHFVFVCVLSLSFHNPKPTLPLFYTARSRGPAWFFTVAGSSKEEAKQKFCPLHKTCFPIEESRIQASPTARGLRVDKRATIVRTENEQESAMKRTPMEWLQWGKVSLRYEFEGRRMAPRWILLHRRGNMITSTK